MSGRAKRESTGAPRSPRRTPDFLSSLLALANFMRLSLMKAAHADIGGAPCRKSGYVGRKRWAQPNDRFRCIDSQLSYQFALRPARKGNVKISQDAVPSALTCLGCFSSKFSQNRHPERSASQICRVTQRLWRGVEGPRRCLSYACCSELFNHRSPRTGPARHALDG
jgi:hypothetical protein